MHEQEIASIIDAMSPGKLKYTQKQATKKGFHSVEEFLLSMRLEKAEIEAKQKAAASSGKVLQSFKRLNKERTPPKEEDIENTFKAYGALTPTSMRDGSRHNDFDKYGTKANLIFMVTMATNTGLAHYTKLFLKYEHLITNHEMFWFLCPAFWCITSQGFNEAVFNRYKRQDVPLKDRLRCEQLFTQFDETDKGNFTLDYQMSRLNKFDDDELIVPVFRVFKVAKGKGIRKSIVKDSPESHLHDEGSSWSYSFLKSASINIGTYLNRHLIKKYAEVSSDDDVEKVLNEVYSTDGSVNKNDATLYDGFYQCVGLFGVKKQYIQFCTDWWGEDELIIDPKDAVLIDYRFLNVLDWLASRWLRDVLDTQKFHNTGYPINRSGIIGVDGMFDLYRIVCKKFLDANPDRLKESLHRWNDGVGWGRLRNDLTNTVKSLCGTELTYPKDVVEGTNVLRAMIGDTPLERFNNGIRQRTVIPKKYLNS